MRAPRRKLRGAFVLSVMAATTAYAGPQIRERDCGILGEDVVPWVDAVRLPGPSPTAAPSSTPEVKLQAGRAVKFMGRKGDQVLVCPLPSLNSCNSHSVKGNPSCGWISTTAVRFARLLSARGVSGLVVMPEQLKAYGRTYPSRKICANHLFTESATFYFTGDSRLPLAVLCTGQLDGEPSTLSLLGPKEALRSKTIEPREGSSSVDDETLVKALDALMRSH